MKLSTILLAIIHRMDGERTMTAGYHLLRGKRSGQTLQDVNYYGLQPFFGILPKLEEAQFKKASKDLQRADFLVVAPNALVALSDAGRAAAEKLPPFHFCGLDYQGRELIFFGRLSLTVQTLSHFRAGHSSFLPVQQDRDIQQFVKRLLAQQPIHDPAFAERLQDELEQALVRSGMSDRQKVIFVHRLAGYQMTGWTWDQVGERLQMDPFDVRLLFIESLHRILRAVETSVDLSFLHHMAENVKVTSYLTESSRKTKQLFECGKTMEEIAAARHLKMSTIEDHFVEMAIHDPSFPLFRFVSEKDVNQVIQKVQEMGTKRLRPLKMEFDALSYFQLRLILSARIGREADGFAEST
ncbi:helix-turn-helix domain-containing protein [Sporosarcina sp. 179-K 3D1 HS]|uniref:helix-turn-helix domain-containing protein n=1 Tax=Sporosarcina sp. 179-K 3D1 HS TaxID=3232169 RepID=UPI0039A3859D